MRFRIVVILPIMLLAFFMSSCKNTNKMSENDKLQAPVSQVYERSDAWLLLQQKYADERADGVDFLAFGQESEWQLRIKNDKSISYTSDSFTFNSPGAEAMQPQDLNAVIYGVEKDGLRFSVMVYSDSCSNQNSETLPNRINITVRDSSGSIVQYKGCGLYLNDPMLNDIWAVKSYSGVSNQKSLPRGAYLEFNMKTERIYGNLGCGDITGYFTPMGSNIKIYGMDYPDKSCKEDGTALKLFNALNFKTLKITKRGLSLELSSETGGTVKFIKAD